MIFMHDHKPHNVLLANGLWFFAKVNILKRTFIIASYNKIIAMAILHIIWRKKYCTALKFFMLAMCSEVDAGTYRLVYSIQRKILNIDIRYLESEFVQ